MKPQHSGPVGLHEVTRTSGQLLEHKRVVRNINNVSQSVKVKEVGIHQSL